MGRTGGEPRLRPRRRRGIEVINCSDASMRFQQVWEFALFTASVQDFVLWKAQLSLGLKCVPNKETCKFLGVFAG